MHCYNNNDILVSIITRTYPLSIFLLLACMLVKCQFLLSATKLRRLCFYTCLSVILFTGGSTPVHDGIHLPLGRPPSRQIHLRQTLPKTDPPSLSGQTPPRQTRPIRQTPLQADPAADGYCCKRYASYWNGFSFFN